MSNFLRSIWSLQRYLLRPCSKLHRLTRHDSRDKAQISRQLGTHADLKNPVHTSAVEVKRVKFNWCINTYLKEDLFKISLKILFTLVDPGGSDTWNKPNRTVPPIQSQKLLKPCNISFEKELCKISLHIAKNPRENLNGIV